MALTSLSRPGVRLALLLLAALAVRLALASWTAPYSVDLGFYVRWARAAVDYGLTQVYPRTGSDYPPAILYLLNVQGWLGDAWGMPLVEPLTRVTTVWLKLPSIVADVLCVWVVYMGVARQLGSRPALWSAALWAFNPAPIYICALWGQTEALYTLPLLLGYVALNQGHIGRGWVGFTLSVLAKLQGISAIPVAIGATVRAGRAAIGRAALAASGTFLILTLPWLLAGRASDIIKVYADSTYHTQQVSVSAYNLWYLLWRGDVHRVSDAGLWLGQTYRLWGLLLAAALAVLVTVRLVRAEANLYLAGAVMALGLFSLPTEIHERYMLPVLPLLLLAAPRCRLARPAFLALSVTFTFNLVTINPVAPWLPANLVATPSGDIGVDMLKALAWLAAAVNVSVLVILTLHLLGDRISDHRLPTADRRPLTADR